MKKIVFLLTCLSAAMAFSSCNNGSNTDNTPLNFKKLTYGKAAYAGNEDGLRHYVLTLWTSSSSTASVDNYKDTDITLSMELAMADEGTGITAGEYIFSAGTPEAGAILGTDNSALTLHTRYDYGGGQMAKLVDGRIEISYFNDKYEIEGYVTDGEERELNFTFYGTITFEGEPAEPATITFEDAELAATTGEYANILWGRELATENEGTPIYNGLLYTEGTASFGSYFEGSAYGDMWGGFAISSNRDLEDLGMDYANQFSVYASDNSQFAIAYIFGDWGNGEYGTPTIEFARPVTVASADFANANKTYFYCKANPTIGSDGAEEDIWVNLVATGYNGDSTETTTVTIPLATGTDVLADWKTFDMSALGTVTKITFDIDSNDTGEWGINVPLFFCMDNIILE